MIGAALLRNRAVFVSLFDFYKIAGTINKKPQ